MRRSVSAVDAALFLLIIAVPLAWTKIFIAEFTLAKLLAVNAALAFAAFAVVLFPKSIASGRTVMDVPIAAGLLIACLSAALSDDPATNLRGRYDSYAYGLWGLALIAATAQLATRGVRGREQHAARWLGWSAGAVGAYAILQKLGIDPVFHAALPAGGRAVSTLGSPVDLGAFLALLWPAALWRLDAERGSIPAVLAALVAGGLIASGARGAMLAAGAGTGIYWLLSRRDPKTALPRSVWIAAAAALSAIAWTCRPGASISDAARVEVWKTAFDIFLQRPWLGWGPDGFEDVFKLMRSERFVALLNPMHYQAYAHNDILHVLVGVGLAGAAAYAWLLATLYSAARRALLPDHGRALPAALFAGLLALCVNLALNPVALEVLILTAVCAGLLVSLTAPPETPAPLRPVLVILAALASVSLLHAVGLARADAAYKRGAKAQAVNDFAIAKVYIARARRAAPCELSYITGELNAIGDWINATHVVEERLALLALAEADARAALSCHPRQSTAHYAAASAARMHAELGFKDRFVDAAREYDRALELDPKFTPLLAARRELSRLQLLAR